MKQLRASVLTFVCVAAAGSVSPLDRWGPFFTVRERICVVLTNHNLSPMLQASELRRVFDELQSVLNEGGFLPAFAASRNDTGVDFTNALLEDLRVR